MKARLNELERLLSDSKSECYLEGLLDAIGALVSDLNYPALRKDKHFDSFLKRWVSATNLLISSFQ